MTYRLTPAMTMLLEENDARCYFAFEFGESGYAKVPLLPDKDVRRLPESITGTGPMPLTRFHNKSTSWYCNDATDICERRTNCNADGLFVGTRWANRYAGKGFDQCNNCATYSQHKHEDWDVRLRSHAIGNTVEVAILDGEFKGKWVKCRILSADKDSGVYSIFVLKTTQYREALGTSETVVEGIGPEHLRVIQED